MIRIAWRLAFLAIPVALGGCFVAAPADDYAYSYGPRPMIVTQPRHYFTDRRYVREYRGRGRHRPWYDHDRNDD